MKMIETDKETKKCEHCGKEKLLSEFNGYTFCNICEKEMDESLMYYCNDDHSRPDRNVYDSKMITSDADKILELLSKCDEETLIQVVHEGMTMILNGMHDEEFPLDTDFIPEEFVNTLLTLAEHINRLKHCQRRVAAKRWIDVYG
jgi:hypothetical protein